MKKQGKKGLTREQAVEIYDDLQKQMAAILRGEAPAKALAKEKSAKTIASNLFTQPRTARIITPHRIPDRGMKAAVGFVILCALIKAGIATFDYLGMFAAENAQATMLAQSQIAKASTPGSYSPEEVRILTSLDSRRVELDQKAKRLDEKEIDISKRDKEYVTKLAELRDLTEKLKSQRDRDDKKKGTQLDQLANVYGSMAPQEAAQLIEQLDITIAFPLLQRMPEKRMGQILPLMSPERALAITKLLSGTK